MGHDIHCLIPELGMLYVPAVQFVHDDAPDGEDCQDRQGMQIPSTEYVPTAQG